MIRCAFRPRFAVMTALGLSLMAPPVQAGAAEPAGMAVPALMPLPQTVTPAPGALVIDGGFRVAIVAPGADPHLSAAVNRLLAGLRARTGLFIKPPEVGTGSPSPATLTVRVTALSPAVPVAGADEGYGLTVGPAGAELQATDAVGIQRGISTFLQLVTPVTGPAPIVAR